MEIEVYTDGSATTANKPGGWAYVLVINGNISEECSNHLASATNNDAELESAIQGLAAALKYINYYPNGHSITLCSDSQLVLGWTSGQYRFKQQEKIEKYKELKSLAEKLNVKTKWIKGHAGNTFNERCDYLANKARLGLQFEEKKEESRVTGDTLIGKKKEGILCVWYGDKLKIIDLTNNLIEDYSREIHGKRGSLLEIREDKVR